MGWRLLLLLCLPPVLLLVCALVLMRIPLPAAWRSHQNLIAAVATGLLGLGYVAGLVVYVVSFALSAGRDIDPAFTSLGFSAESYLLFQRQYRGTFQGRTVRATYAPPLRYPYRLLDVYVDAPLTGRLAVVQKGPLLIDCRDCQPMELGAELGSLQALADPPGWGNALLAQGTVREAILRLLGEWGPFEQGELYMEPGKLWLRAHLGPAVTVDELQQWLTDLSTLAQAAEDLPSPDD